MKRNRNRDYIIANYNVMDVSVIAYELGISVSTVKWYASKYKLKKGRSTVKLEFLKKHYATTSTKDIAELFDCTEESIRALASIHGLKKIDNFKNNQTSIKSHYNLATVRFIKERFSTTDTNELSKITGLSYDMINKIAGQYKLKKIIAKRGNNMKDTTKIIIEKYPTMDTEELAKLLNISVGNVRDTASRYNIKKKTKCSPELKEYIKEHYSTMDTKKIAEKFNVEPVYVNGLANRLGITKQPRKDKEYVDKFIIENYSKMSNKEIATILNIKPSYVNLIATRNKLNKDKTERNNFIKENYATMDVDEIANKFNITADSVRYIANSLGVSRAKKSRSKKTLANEKMVQLYYGKKPAKEIAAACDIAVVTVYNIANRLGIKKNK